MFKKEASIEKIKQNWEKPAIMAIMLLAAFLTCFEIWNEGYGNEFYTAAVKSMTMSWHNFFFASLDPGGFITVDKPAPGLWLQCLFALIFGVNGWSVILPEALCSVASVWVLWRIVKRNFGKTAGLLAALFLSLTPIFIAASRSNNLDAALVLVCLLSVWAILRAAEEGSLKFLLLSMALIGVGFNIKTLQAYLYLPALYLVYFFAANTTWKKRIIHLIIATAVLLVVSLFWALTVDLIPASDRPYVGSSSTNSELELAIGYNGLDRALPSSVLKALGSEGISDSSSDSELSSVISSNIGVPDEGGQTGVLRMFNNEMAGQASWLIALAIFGMLALLLDIVTRPKGERKPLVRLLICWAGLFFPMYALFSMSSHFHRYYLIMFAPCIAALSAIGFTEMWGFYKRRNEVGFRRAMRWMLPVAIAVTAAVQIYIISDYSTYSSIFIPIICIGSGVSCAGFVACSSLQKEDQGITKFVAALGLLAVLAAPAYWSLTPIIFGSNASIPVAGPSGKNQMFGGGGGMGMNMGDGKGKVDGNSKPEDGNSGKNRMPDEKSGVGEDGNRQNDMNSQNSGTHDGKENGNGMPDGAPGAQFGGGSRNFDGDMKSRMEDGFGDALPEGGSATDGFGGMGGGMGGTISDSVIQYMMRSYNGERYLVAVPSAGYAEPIIIKYGVGVMAMGGFKGDDNAISLDDFIKLVQSGEVRYYWAAGEGRTSSEITKWVEENGRQVSNSEMTGETESSGTSLENTASVSYLYDLSALKNS